MKRFEPCISVNGGAIPCSWSTAGRAPARRQDTIHCLKRGTVMERGRIYSLVTIGVAVGALYPRPASALYANSVTYAPNAGTGRVDINVCWENPDSSPGGTSWLTDRQQAIEESWSRNARVNFYGWGTCTGGAAGLHIVICNLPTDSRCPALPASQSQPGGYPAND